MPQISQPIFTAGRLRSGVKFAGVRARCPIREDPFKRFFRGFKRAIAHQQLREKPSQQEGAVHCWDRTRLAYVRYRGGVDTQLNALDADRDLFQAQLTLAEIRLSGLLGMVQLYRRSGWS